MNVSGLRHDVFDFHTHTFYSDGVLSPMEQARRAAMNGYAVLGLTDHVGVGGVGPLLEALRQDREIIESHWPIKVVVGVELTHLPAEAIRGAAEHARSEGAEIVVVHGETPVEPVPDGTNRAAVNSGVVDVLAHPGLLTPDDARIAHENGVFLEVTSRRGHSLTNGHVVQVARATGAKILVNSDSHEPADLLTAAFQERVARGSGLRETDLEAVLQVNPNELLQRVLSRRT